MLNYHFYLEMQVKEKDMNAVLVLTPNHRFTQPDDWACPLFYQHRTEVLAAYDQVLALKAQYLRPAQRSELMELGFSTDAEITLRIMQMIPQAIASSALSLSDFTEPPPNGQTQQEVPGRS